MSTRYTHIFYIINLILLSLGTFNTIGAQLQQVAHFTTEDGLPSNTIYDIIEDDRGYIWLATDNGVVRWDGYQFKRFGIEEGLPTNDVWLLHNDENGKIWCINSINIGVYILDSKVHRVAFPDQYKMNYFDILTLPKGIAHIKEPIQLILDSIMIQTPDTILDYFESMESTSLLYLHHYHVLKTVNYNKIDFFKSHIDFARDKYFGQSNWHLTKGDTSILCLRDDKIIEIIVDAQKVKEIALPKVAGTLRVPLYRNGLLQIDAVSGSFLIDIHKGKIIDKYIFPEFKNHSRSLSTRNHIISGTTGDGFFIFHKNNNLATKNKLHKNLLCWSKESSIYNRKDSIILENSNTVNTFAQSKTGHQHIFTNGNKCCLINNSRLIYNQNKSVHYQQLYYESSKTDPRLRTLKTNFFASSITKAGFNDSLFLATDRKILYHGKIDNNALNVVAHRKSIHDLCISDQSIYTTNNDSLFEFHNIDSSTFISKSPDGEIIKHVFADPLLVLTEHSAYSLNNNSLELISPLPRNTYNATYLSSILAFCDQMKIYLLNTSSGRTHQISRLKHVPFRRINQLILNQDSLLVRGLNESINIPLNVFTNNNVSNTPHLEITSSLPEENLTTTNPNISFQFNSISPLSLGEVIYEYRLLPTDTTWTSTKSRELRFSSLSPDKYTLEAKSINLFGEVSHTKNRDFHITPVWHQSLWFYLLISLLTMITVIYLVSRSTRIKAERIARRQELESKISSVQLEALRSQMNPHFVFNSLAAIQNYIRQSKKEEADDYLTMFAQLIRSFFEYSQKPTITIQKEIELINKYVSLENLRFQNEIDYQVDIAPEVDLYQEIPSLILQPFVENAIHHGLFHKEGSKQLLIRITEEDDTLNLVVKDNGIGREKSAEYRSKKHKSKGTAIMVERFQTINSTSEFYIKSQIFDHAKPTGTQVLITINTNIK